MSRGIGIRRSEDGAQRKYDEARTDDEDSRPNARDLAQSRSIRETPGETRPGRSTAILSRLSPGLCDRALGWLGHARSVKRSASVRVIGSSCELLVSPSRTTSACLASRFISRTPDELRRLAFPPFDHARPCGPRSSNSRMSRCGPPVGNDKAQSTKRARPANPQTMYAKLGRPGRWLVPCTQ